MKILLIDAYGLHRGFLGMYGNEWVPTPTLDLLAARGVVFDQHYVCRPRGPGEDSGSCAWTGRYQFCQAGADAAAPSFPETLARHDIALVRTACHSLHEFPATVKAALAKVKRSKHWLLWLDGPNLAPPWDIPEKCFAPFFPQDDEEADDPWPDPPRNLDENDLPDRLRLQDTYAAVIHYFDVQLGALLTRAALDDVVIVITAQSGLPLGEHGSVGLPSPWMHDELWHVPFVLYVPESTQAGWRVPALTQAVDLWPTLLDLFEVEDEKGHGHSVLPLMRGEAERVRAYACGGCRVGSEEEWALRTEEWSLLVPIATAGKNTMRAVRLYKKPEDRWEVNDLRQHYLEMSEGMEKTLRAFAQAVQGPGSLQPPPLDLE